MGLKKTLELDDYAAFSGTVASSIACHVFSEFQIHGLSMTVMAVIFAATDTFTFKNCLQEQPARREGKADSTRAGT